MRRKKQNSGNVLLGFICAPFFYIGLFMYFIFLLIIGMIMMNKKKISELKIDYSIGDFTAVIQHDDIQGKIIEMNHKKFLLYNYSGVHKWGYKISELGDNVETFGYNSYWVYPSAHIHCFRFKPNGKPYFNGIVNQTFPK